MFSVDVGVLARDYLLAPEVRAPWTQSLCAATGSVKSQRIVPLGHLIANVRQRSSNQLRVDPNRSRGTLLPLPVRPQRVLNPATRPRPLWFNCVADPCWVQGASVSAARIAAVRCWRMKPGSVTSPPDSSTQPPHWRSSRRRVEAESRRRGRGVPPDKERIQVIRERASGLPTKAGRPGRPAPSPGPGRACNTRLGSSNTADRSGTA